MRIALIAFHFTEYSYALASALAQSHDVLLITDRSQFDAELGPGPSMEMVKGLTIEFLDWDRKILTVARNAAKLVRLVRGFQPDVIHAQEVVYDYYLAAIPFLSRFPLVLTVHDPTPHTGEEWSSLPSRRFRLYQSIQRRLADETIVHGELLRLELERALPKLQGHVTALRHGVLGNLPFDPTPQHPRAGTALFLGRMHPYKGLAIFITAINALTSSGFTTPEGLPVRAVIAGRGPSLMELKSSIEDLPQFTVIDTYLEREEMIGLVDQSEVVVLPYLDGTQSGIAALAIGRARPVVATNVGCLTDMVVHESNGLVVPPGDPTALAAALRAMMSDGAMRRRHRDQAATMGDFEFSWAQIAGETMNVYVRAVQAHRESQR